jgi:hypothetical protein
MTILEARGFRRQVLGKVREFEGHLRRLEGQLVILRGKADRAVGEAQVKLGTLLGELERDAEKVREAGHLALEGLERAAQAGRDSIEQLKTQVAALEAQVPSVSAKGRAVVRRASIEAKALRHGVRVGLRVARRVARRVKAAKT